MISLNLISPEQQKILRIRYIYLSIKNLLLVVALLTLLSALVLIPWQIRLVDLTANVKTFKILSSKQSNSIGKKINELNDKILSLSAIQSAGYAWPDLLSELSQITPEGVYLLKINANSEVKVFTINGYALTRDSLLKFKANLDKSPYFKNVESPLTNYLEESNIDFEIKGLLK